MRVLYALVGISLSIAAPLLLLILAIKFSNATNKTTNCKNENT